jgi:acylphosphatase
MTIRVTGRVQGVSFRDAARRQATHLALQGFARNEPDGSVYIEAEGSELALQQFLTWASQGSPEAHVEAVEHQVREPAGHNGFEIY